MIITGITLVLNKENEIYSTSANVLDLEITINRDKFLSKVSDKRDNFKFDIVSFSLSRAINLVIFYTALFILKLYDIHGYVMILNPLLKE